MARVRVNFGGPFNEILNSAETRALLTSHASSVLGAAKAGAPVDSGAYQASLHIKQDTTDRAVVRVVAGVPYAMNVEARYGTLSRALDSA
jgi:hypothetical protein